MNENHLVEILVEEVNGYPTFNGVEDRVLRNRNRGTIAVNIVEDATYEGCSKEVCWERVRAYFMAIPQEDHAAVRSAMQIVLESRQPMWIKQ